MRFLVQHYFNTAGEFDDATGASEAAAMKQLVEQIPWETPQGECAGG